MIPIDQQTAYKISLSIIDRGVLHINFESPFRWSSGIVAPVYCDNRVVMAYHLLRNFVREELSKGIRHYFGICDAIGGVATGGIAPAILIAHYMETFFFYVRPAPKTHGLGLQIEGIIKNIKTAVIVEDLISTGQSCLAAVRAVKEAGIDVKGVACIFHYNFPDTLKRFEKEGVPCIALTTFDITMNVAWQKGFISREDYHRLVEWHRSVSIKWSNTGNI